MIFLFHRTVSMAAVYQLKIKHEQHFLHAKGPVSFAFEDKHIVNESHVTESVNEAWPWSVNS